MESDLRNQIAEIIMRGVTYNHQTGTVIIHGAIDDIVKLIQQDAARSRQFKYKRMETIHKINMKEQDAAHSFTEGMKCKKCGGDVIMFTSDLDVCQKCGTTYEPRSAPTQAQWIAELTRLRSELQDTKSYYEDKLDARQRTIDQQFSELQQAKQEIANHIAVNSLLTDSDGEADLANKLYRATSELQQERELRKELTQKLTYFKHDTGIVDKSNWREIEALMKKQS